MSGSTAARNNAGSAPRRASTPGRASGLGTGRRSESMLRGDARGDGPHRTGRSAGSYVDGANALQIGYADPVEADPIESDAYDRDAAIGYERSAGTRTATRPRPTDRTPRRTSERTTEREAERTGQRSPARATDRLVPRQRQRARLAEPTEVAAPLPISLPRAPFLVLMASLVVVGVVGVLLLNTKINENAFQIDNLRAQQAGLDLQQQQANQQLTDLESTGNLNAAAAGLGLVPAGTGTFLTLPNGRVVGVPQPANGGQQQSTASNTDPGR